MVLPTVVIETGYTQPLKDVGEKRDLWLFGGHGGIEVVILIKWYKRKSSCTVKGYIEVFALD